MLYGHDFAFEQTPVYVQVILWNKKKTNLPFHLLYLYSGVKGSYSALNKFCNSTSNEQEQSMNIPVASASHLFMP